MHAADSHELIPFGARVNNLKDSAWGDPQTPTGLPGVSGRARVRWSSAPSPRRNASVSAAPPSRSPWRNDGDHRGPSISTVGPPPMQCSGSYSAVSRDPPGTFYVARPCGASAVMERQRTVNAAASHHVPALWEHGQVTDFDLGAVPRPSH